MVSTHLKNISQNGNLTQVGVKINNIWNHHLASKYQTAKRTAHVRFDHGSPVDGKEYMHKQRRIYKQHLQQYSTKKDLLKGDLGKDGKQNYKKRSEKMFQPEKK